jgi:predicted nucleotidyltransferase
MIVPILGTTESSPPQHRTSLADALFTKTQQRVLGVLFGNPDRSFYTQELIRAAGAGSGAAQREVTKLERSGLVVSHRVGHQKHFQANRSSPLFPELRGLVMKTVGLAEPLRAALKPLLSSIRIAFVYGSVAKEVDRAGSDIDLMIVSDVLSYGELFGSLEDPSRKLGREVNPTVYTSTEFSQRKREGNTFLTRVLEQPKIWIIGDDDEL